MNKKQIKELEADKKTWMLYTSIFLIGFIFLLLMYAGAVNRNREIKTGLEAELRQCRRQDGFTIHYVCDRGWMNQTIINSYQSFESYEMALENIKGYEDCEVVGK